MLIQEVFTKKQAMAVYRADDLIERINDGRIQLRETNQNQTMLIRRYMLDNLMSGHVYVPPIVAYVEEPLIIEDNPEHLIIIDGTQRLKALVQLKPAIAKLMNSENPEEHKKGYVMNHMLTTVEIAVQIFEGMTSLEADQLFIDLNTKGKKVALSKRIAYDSRNELNRTTNRLVESHQGLRRAGVEQEKISIRRPTNKNLLSLSQLRQLVGYFMTGKSVNGKFEVETESAWSMEEHLEVVGSWFDELFALYPEETIGDYEESMLASFTLLLALAQYAYEGVEYASLEVKKRTLSDRMRRLSHVDWRRDQPLWKEFRGSKKGKDQYYYVHQDKPTYDAIVAWLRLKGGEA